MSRVNRLNCTLHGLSSTHRVGPKNMPELMQFAEILRLVMIPKLVAC